MTGRAKALASRLLGRGGDSQEWRKWAATDRYVCEHLGLKDAVTESAVAAIEAAGMPPIGVAATQGKMLELLGRLVGARRILELGTLGGYSTIWLARAVAAGGRPARDARVPPALRRGRAREHRRRRAGRPRRAARRGGAGRPAGAREGGEPFDLIFIDADKGNYPPTSTGR